MARFFGTCRQPLIAPQPRSCLRLLDLLNPFLSLPFPSLSQLPIYFISHCFTTQHPPPAMAEKGNPGPVPAQVQPSTKIEQPSSSSRLAKNNQKWNSLKGKIRELYMTEDKTLAVTMGTMEKEHGFKAR